MRPGDNARMPPSPAPPAPLPLSGVVITRNEADRIGRCLASMAPACAELLVVDSGSDDDTVAIARAHGAQVRHQPWLGFAAQKTLATSLAAQPWVLLLDADEWLADGAAEALRALFASGELEHRDVWCLRRRTRFLGRPLRFGGWSREWVHRLSRPDMRYLPALVHEGPDLAGKRVGHCGSVRIEHETARSLEEYRRKLRGYAELWAKQRARDGRRAGAAAAPVHALAYWLKHYVLQGGVLDGATGWRFHACHTRYVYEKYALLRGMQRR